MDHFSHKTQAKEVQFVLIPQQSQLYRFLKHVIGIMKETYDDYDKITDDGLKIVADFIKSMGFIPRKTMVNESGFKEFSSDLRVLRDEIKPILKHFIIVANVSLKFASGQLKIPVQIAELLHGFMTANPEIMQILHDN